MARSLDQNQQRELTTFVNAIAQRAGYETTAEWARDSGYPAPNLSNLRNGRGAIDGYNLLRLIRAAAKRAGVSPADLAETQAAETEELSDRLRAVEEGLTDLASEIRRSLSRPEDSGSSQALHGKQQEGRIA